MKPILFLFILISLVHVSNGQKSAIIPEPLKMVVSKGEASFTFNKSISIITDHKYLSEAKILSDYLKKVTGFSIIVKEAKDQLPSGHTILLKDETKIKTPKEGYAMNVSGEGIQVKASDPAGIFFGCMSLLQAIDYSKKSNEFTIHAMYIEDQPRFGWRGLMLDCSRTFVSLDYLKKTIDRMSFYKLNTLHLHLTDDQGWRLEIKKYPLLTSKGAFFAAKYNEPKEFEGFYTQAQMRDLINYAHQRHVQIVPEIEVPGHSHAALYAYPELSCSGDITPVFPFFSGPNMTGNDVFCAGNENTYLFFKNVIKEVANVFPSSYIHLGGDEVRDAWKNCKKCQALIISNNLSDEKGLQGYVMNKVGNYVTTAKKRPIGWDEVIHTGVGKETIIMIWRELDRGVKEVKMGYDVILTPHSNLYFDFSYQATPIKKVYSFEPIPEGINNDEEKHYLGIQGSFWNHIDRTESKTDYQIYPRLLALAERAWSDKSLTNYDDFYQRLLKQEFWLKYFNVKYRSY